MLPTSSPPVTPPPPPAPLLRTLYWTGALLVVGLLLLDGNVDALRDLLTAPERRPAAQAEPSAVVDVEPTPELQSLPEAVIAAGGPAFSVAAARAPALFGGRRIEDVCLVAGAAGGCGRHAMDAFYRALSLVAEGHRGAVARVVHFGDSIVAEDAISSRLRELLQGRFGDAGAGFIYAARPSRWYQRFGVRHETSPWRVCSVVTSGSCEGSADKQLGLGGAAFAAAPGGSTSRFSTTEPGQTGDKVASYDLYYLRQPAGGRFTFAIDDEPEQVIDTAADSVQSAFRRLEVPEGPHTLKLSAKGDRVRTFGTVMERSGPGVVYDSLGIVSNSARAMALIEPEHWRDQLRHRNPDLVLVLLGTNEADYIGTGPSATALYEATFAGMLGRIREAQPEKSCLVIAALDAATLHDGALVTKPALPHIVEAQRRAAAAKGCAFWNTFQWMGGKGSMATWFARGWVASDYTHPSRAGAARVAGALYAALMNGYEQFLDGEKAE